MHMLLISHLMFGNLHWLCVWAFSCDDALFVHQHLSECAHFLSNLFLCVPVDEDKNTQTHIQS